MLDASIDNAPPLDGRSGTKYEPAPRTGSGWRRWLDEIDPGTHRRIKGLRLVTAYGIAAMMGTLQQITQGLPDDSALSSLAGGFALWGSVSEARSTRGESARDLVLLCWAAALGAISTIVMAPLLSGPWRPGPECILATGAFFVGYGKRFGVLGAGMGSQLYIGQLLAFSAGLRARDLPIVAVAGALASLATVVPRVLSGPAERPAAFVPVPRRPGQYLPPELAMGLQAAAAAGAIIALTHLVRLQESAWAITASTYVIAGTAAGTMDRVRRRVLGTLVGVPLGVACLPLATKAPLLLWIAAAAAMVIYAISLPVRYDVACAAFAFTLMVTLAASGVHSPELLMARLWETLIGSGLGLAAALLIFPLKKADPAS
jgi:hypothetical protein